MPLKNNDCCIICNKSMEEEYVCICHVCKEGVCSKCMNKIHSETDKLTKEYREKCEFCTDNYDKFCSECLEHIKGNIELHIKWFQNNKHESEIIFRLYGVRNIDDVTFDIGKARFMREWGTYICDCNNLCKCYDNARTNIKMKYNVNDLKMYEIYDEGIEYCISVCGSCIDQDKYDLTTFKNFF